MKTNLEPLNSKGENHGYHESYVKFYNKDSKISHRGIWKANRLIAYNEWHGMQETNFYIK
jgi:hypothetical protein